MGQLETAEVLEGAERSEEKAGRVFSVLVLQMVMVLSNQHNSNLFPSHLNLQVFQAPPWHVVSRERQPLCARTSKVKMPVPNLSLTYLWRRTLLLEHIPHHAHLPRPSSVYLLLLPSQRSCNLRNEPHHLRLWMTTSRPCQANVPNVDLAQRPHQEQLCSLVRALRPRGREPQLPVSRLRVLVLTEEALVLNPCNSLPRVDQVRLRHQYPRALNSTSSSSNNNNDLHSCRLRLQILDKSRGPLVLLALRLTPVVRSLMMLLQTITHVVLSKHRPNTSADRPLSLSSPPCSVSRPSRRMVPPSKRMRQAQVRALTSNLLKLNKGIIRANRVAHNMASRTSLLLAGPCMDLPPSSPQFRQGLMRNHPCKHSTNVKDP